jgi:DNA-binding transcriptional ArsR family regulator
MTRLRYLLRMEPDIASVAALISEPARARILIALLDGRSLPATELAQRAGITCPTASSHLAKLAVGKLLQVIPQGRHRYYRIANARVAELLESMGGLLPEKRRSVLKTKVLLRKRAPVTITLRAAWRLESPRPSLSEDYCERWVEITS